MHDCQHNSDQQAEVVQTLPLFTQSRTHSKKQLRLGLVQHESKLRSWVIRMRRLLSWPVAGLPVARSQNPLLMGKAHDGFNVLERPDK